MTNLLQFRRREQVLGKVFIKKVVREKHLFKAANAYAVDTDQLEYFAAAGVTEIQFHEDTGTTYSTTPAEFRVHGFEKQYPGYSRQTFLPLRYWRSANASPAPAYSEQSATDNLTSEPQEKQLFFSGWNWRRE